MMNSHNSLSYSDERDKSYGIAGMAITLVVLDGENYLSRVDLDADAGSCIEMSHEFGFKGNPRMSAKIIWEQTLRDLRLTASMALGNVACRRYVLGHRALSAADTRSLRDALCQDASEHCGLENDETERLFDSCLAYVDRIFRTRGVSEIADAFAKELSSRRNMSGSEVSEILSQLGLQ